MATEGKLTASGCFPFRRARTSYGSVILMLRRQFTERRGHLLFHTEVQLAFAFDSNRGGRLSKEK